MKGIEACFSLPILLLQKKPHHTTEFYFCSELGDDFLKDKGVQCGSRPERNWDRRGAKWTRTEFKRNWRVKEIKETPKYQKIKKKKIKTDHNKYGAMKFV